MARNLNGKKMLLTMPSFTSLDCDCFGEGVSRSGPLMQRVKKTTEKANANAKTEIETKQIDI